MNKLVIYILFGVFMISFILISILFDIYPIDILNVQQDIIIHNEYLELGNIYSKQTEKVVFHISNHRDHRLFLRDVNNGCKCISNDIFNHGQIIFEQHESKDVEIQITPNSAYNKKNLELNFIFVDQNGIEIIVKKASVIFSSYGMLKFHPAEIMSFENKINIPFNKKVVIKNVNFIDINNLAIVSKLLHFNADLKIDDDDNVVLHINSIFKEVGLYNEVIEILDLRTKNEKLYEYPISVNVEDYIIIEPNELLFNKDREKQVIKFYPNGQNSILEDVKIGTTSIKYEELAYDSVNLIMINTSDILNYKSKNIEILISTNGLINTFTIPIFYQN